MATKKERSQKFERRSAVSHPISDVYQERECGGQNCFTNPFEDRWHVGYGGVYRIDCHGNLHYDLFGLSGLR